MFRDFVAADRTDYLEMSRDFYSGGAVAHAIPDEHFERTFKLCVEGSPFVRGLMIEKDGQRLGYGLLSFTYSNEAGGNVVLVEELYLKDGARGKGLGSAFFAFIETEYPCTKRFRLEVSHGNQGAYQLYERLGYRELPYIQMVKPQ